MPLKKKEKELILRLAKAYNVKRLWLFGSMLDAHPEAEPNDIDLAVEGIPAEKFFDFYADLGRQLDKTVDLIELSACDDYMISSIIRRKGKPIYEERKQDGKKTVDSGHSARKAAYR